MKRIWSGKQRRNVSATEDYIQGMSKAVSHMNSKYEFYSFAFLPWSFRLAKLRNMVERREVSFCECSQEFMI